jgi:hypothetical protein
MRTFVLVIAFLSLVRIASAHLQAAPDLGTIATSDEVYLVHAGEVSGSHRAFLVDEVLRGPQRTSLSLEPYPGGDTFTAGSAWIIFRHKGGFPNHVGWAMKGDCEWLPVSAKPGIGTRVSRYHYSVDEIRAYLKTHSPNP